MLNGFSYSGDTDWQGLLEESFPYKETKGQITATEELKKDMERKKPMDRLLCGDVGYGKTEVALRAAFKAVMDNKQVAILVPTTVLAEQHYITFKERMKEFPVNIALIEDGVPIAGVVYAPAIGRMFRSLGAGGAVEEAVDADGVPVADTLHDIRVSPPDNAALVIVASKSHRDQATDDYISRYRVADFKSAGSSLKFCLVAAGEADFYPRLGRTMEWDTAAGHAVLRAAGGQVLRFEDHQPLTYGKPEYENPFFLAMAPGVALCPANVRP